MYSDTIIIIPSRLGSTRLKEKPLQKIGAHCMIELVTLQAMKTNIPVYVATDSEAIADKVNNLGATAVMTGDSNSGTDRIYEAFKTIKNEHIKYVVNVQGDMPFIKPEGIVKVVDTLKNSKFGIVTPVVKVDEEKVDGPSNVKVVVSKSDTALYFSRSLIPYNSQEFLYHVGVYGFDVDVLDRFVKLPQSQLEISENLEQLRALDNGIDIGVCYIDDVPISVDTQEDLDKAIKFL